MKVAVGIIVNQNKDILITKRKKESSHGDKWEFPGGKLNRCESQEAGLAREIKEEVGLLVEHAIFFMEVCKEPLQLFFYYITKFKGVAKCCEAQQALQWVNPRNLLTYEFPETNILVIKRLLQHLK